MADERVLVRIAEDTLERCKQGLAGVGTPVPELAYVHVGEIAWDVACEAYESDGWEGPGQLVVSVGSLFPFVRFPTPAANPVRCDPPEAAANMVASIVRCVPSLGVNGDAPTAEQLHEASTAAMVDGYALWRAVACAMPTWWDVWSVSGVMGLTTFVGPQGGAIGVEVRFTVSLPDLCRCS